MTRELEFSRASLGQSGAILKLYEDSTLGPKYLRKTSSIVQPLSEMEHQNASITSANPERLIRQARLQADAHASEYFSMLKIPEVLKISLSEGYFDMEFLDSIPLGEALSFLQNDKLENIASTIEAYLFEPREQVEVSDVEAEAVRSKVAASLSSCPELKFDSIENPNEIAQLLLDAMKGATFCRMYHGDFSLDNILWEPQTNTLAVVDFLDGPIGSRLSDAGRLYLDLRFGWWVKPNEPSAAKFSRQYLLRKIFSRASITTDSVAMGGGQHAWRALKAAAYLCVLRIQPYTLIPRRTGLNLFAAQTLLRELMETE